MAFNGRGNTCAALARFSLGISLLLLGCDAWTTAQGTVRGTDGNPIAGATVTLEGESDVRTFRSATDGRYLVSLWQPPVKAEYKLSVTKTGFVPYEKHLKGPATYQNLDVVLQPASPNSRLPQEPVTPQSIARAMFPNAPEKTKSVSCFRALNREMSVSMVVQKCGRPDEEVGSGIYIFVWHLHDGSTVSMGQPYLERIGDIRLTDASGKTTSLLDNK